MADGAPTETTMAPHESKGRPGRAHAHGSSAPEELHHEAQTALAVGDLEVARIAIERLGRSLEMHFALEDRVYFPALATLRADLAGTLQRFREEHDSMLTYVTEILAALAQQDATAAAEGLDDLITGFLRHEGREEAMLGALERREEI